MQYSKGAHISEECTKDGQPELEAHVAGQQGHVNDYVFLGYAQLHNAFGSPVIPDLFVLGYCMLLSTVMSQ